VSSDETTAHPADEAAIAEAEELVRSVVRDEHPKSLGQLRRMLAERGSGSDLLGYVVMRMVNRRELELTSDRRLIDHLS
jgi:hypothetical protein